MNEFDLDKVLKKTLLKDMKTLQSTRFFSFRDPCKALIASGDNFIIYVDHPFGIQFCDDLFDMHLIDSEENLATGHSFWSAE